MAIISSAFGRVSLTDEDAKKFDRQVKYGRSSKQASDNVKEGRALAAAFFASNGSLSKPSKR